MFLKRFYLRNFLFYVENVLIEICRALNSLKKKELNENFDRMRLKKVMMS